VTGGFFDTSSNFHPYECDGRGSCIHCDLTVTETHQPKTCALCNDTSPSALQKMTVAELEAAVDEWVRR
jgi:ferredoxin